MAIGSLYRPFVEIAEEAGIDIDRELAALGLSYARLMDPSTRLTPDQGRSLVRNLLRRCGDGEIGLHAAARIQLTDMDLLGYLTRHSEHLLGAAHLIARYDRLLGDSAAFCVEEHGARVRLSLGLSTGPWLPEGADFAAAAMHRVFKDLSSGRAVPLEVRLPRARPRRAHVYHDFFGAPVVFGAELPELVYARAPLCVPFQQSDPRLLGILQAQADETCTNLPSADSWPARVRAEVSRGLEHGDYDLARVAKRCRISERTLRRRLDEVGSSYREVVDDVRRERALGLIEAGERRVTTIARVVGYTDATAFARAFRRWTSLTPQHYMARSTGRASAVSG